MKKWSCLFLLCALCLPVLQLGAQEKPKAEERAKVPTPVKVQIVFTEQEGERRISSVPYSFLTLAPEKPEAYEGTSIRHGVRLPIEVDGKEQKTTYLDLGTNIDCRILAKDDGRFHISLIVERSAIYPGSAAGDEKQDIPRPNGQPLIRTFRANESIILKDGQTSENILSTDPLSGRTLRVTVTINVQK
jgi:hypothetical protein